MVKICPQMKCLPLLALMALFGCALLGAPDGRYGSPKAPASPRAYVNVNYSKLSSRELQGQYDGKFIRFKAMFLGEYDAPLVYKGMNPEKKIYINHRDVAYVAEKGPLGGSDMSMPAFPLTASEGLSDFIHSLRRGDLVDVRGYATSRGLILGTGTDIYVDIYEIARL